MNIYYSEQNLVMLLLHYELFEILLQQYKSQNLKSGIYVYVYVYVYVQGTIVGYYLLYT